MKEFFSGSSREGEIPPPGTWTALALVEGPLIEKVGEFAGRLVPAAGRGVEAITKALPFAWLQRLMKASKPATEEQQQEDGKRVIKVHDAIQIVENWLGVISESIDALHSFLPAPGTEGQHSLLDEIAEEMRKEALPQNKPKHVLQRTPNKQGKRKGSAVDWTRRKSGDHKKHIEYPADPDYPEALPKPIGSGRG